MTNDAPNITTLSSFTGQVIVADPLLACDAIANADAVAGTVAIVERGTCPFNTKAQNLADAGAIGMLIVDNTFGDTPMSPFNAGGGHALPMWTLRRAEGLALLAAVLALGLAAAGCGGGSTPEPYPRR